MCYSLRGECSLSIADCRSPMMRLREVVGEARAFCAVSEAASDPAWRLATAAARDCCH